jgi:hypothetical protein
MTVAQQIEQASREDLDAINGLVKDAEKSLQKWTEVYGRRSDDLRKAEAELAARRGDDGAVEIAEPTSSFFGISYQWFDLIAVGPFQRIQPLGPFAPARVIRAGELAVLLAAVWRNPFPLPGGANPSAAQIMTGQQYTVRGQTVNVNQVANGPDLGPVNAVFGAGNVDVFPLVIPSLPAPQDGTPLLLDISLTIDVRSGVSGLPPFAGYASRWFQLDTEPPFVFPPRVVPVPGIGNIPLPQISVPGLAQGFINDTPVRVLIYS